MPNRATSAKVVRRSAVESLAAELGPWTTGSSPRFRQLATGIARAIERGALAHGARLPAERALAVALGVSRGTAVAAYDLLQSDALIERRAGSGTYVAGGDPANLPGGREGTTLVHRLVDRGGDPPGLIDLSVSVLHDAASLPLVGLSTADLMQTIPASGLNPWGSHALRELVARHLTAWSLPTVAGQVVITTGAQQGISAAAACWVRAGDTVVIDDPTYPGAIAAFDQAGAHLVSVPVDRHGVQVGPLRDALARRPALVYLQSPVHSPTGTILSAERRSAIAKLVRATRVPLVEDMALADRTWPEVGAPVAALAGDASVAVIGSLSKLFWGGLRVGFVRAPEPLALRFARIKATQDLGSPAAGQLLAERLLAAADHGFVRRTNAELRDRCDAFSAALARVLPEWTFDAPRGGLSLWVRIPGRGSAFAVTARRHGVVIATSEGLSPAGGHGDRLRLAFSAPVPILLEASRRLRDAWRRHVAIATSEDALPGTAASGGPAPRSAASPNPRTVPSARATQ